LFISFYFDVMDNKSITIPLKKSLIKCVVAGYKLKKENAAQCGLATKKVKFGSRGF